LEQVQRVEFTNSPPVLADGGKREKNQFITASVVSYYCYQLYLGFLNLVLLIN